MIAGYKRLALRILLPDLAAGLSPIDSSAEAEEPARVAEDARVRAERVRAARRYADVLFQTAPLVWGPSGEGGRERTVARWQWIREQRAQGRPTGSGTAVRRQWYVVAKGEGR